MFQRGKMQQAFLVINGVRTNVVTYGRWVEETPESHEPEDIILVIPGNPGVTGFYKPFMQRIHEKTNCPVWIVGHAGHEIPKNNSVDPIPGLKGNEKVFGLEGQVQHKVDFIKKFVPENARLHLIGHSIGSYMILETLKDEEVKKRIANVNFLFGTVEYMADTPNGKFLTTYIKPILRLIFFLSLIYTLLPTFLSSFLTICYMKITGMAEVHLKTVMHFIHPSILQKVFYLACEELYLVQERNNKVIKENLKKIRFYYSYADGWAPLTYLDNLKKDIPGVNAEVCQYNHAFVLNQSLQVADLIESSVLAI